MFERCPKCKKLVIAKHMRFAKGKHIETIYYHKIRDNYSADDMYYRIWTPTRTTETCKVKERK